MGNHFSCISQIIAEPDVIMLKKQQRSEEIGVWKMHRIRVANGMTNNGNSENGVLQINNNKNNVILIIEEVRLGLSLPVSAAELMVESPGHFVCCLNSSTVTACDERSGSGMSSNRAMSGPRPLAAAMAADELLKPGHVYLLMPMKRLHTRFSDDEIQALRKKLLHHQAGGSSSSSPTATLICQTCTPPIANFENGHYAPPEETTPSSLPPFIVGHLESPCQDDQNDGHVTVMNHGPPAALDVGMMDTYQNYNGHVTVMNHGPPAPLDVGMMKTYTRSKSWVPRLETITEVSPGHLQSHGTHRSLAAYARIPSSHSFHSHHQRRHPWTGGVRTTRMAIIG